MLNFIVGGLFIVYISRMFYILCIIIIADRKVYKRFKELARQARTEEEAHRIFVLTLEYDEDHSSVWLKELDLTKWSMKKLCGSEHVYEELFEKEFYE